MAEHHRARKARIDFEYIRDARPPPELHIDAASKLEAVGDGREQLRDGCILRDLAASCHIASELPPQHDGTRLPRTAAEEAAGILFLGVRQIFLENSYTIL